MNLLPEYLGNFTSFFQIIYFRPANNIQTPNYKLYKWELATIREIFIYRYELILLRSTSFNILHNSIYAE